MSWTLRQVGEVVLITVPAAVILWAIVSPGSFFQTVANMGLGFGDQAFAGEREKQLPDVDVGLRETFQMVTAALGRVCTGLIEIPAFPKDFAGAAIRLRRADDTLFAELTDQYGRIVDAATVEGVPCTYTAAASRGKWALSGPFFGDITIAEPNKANEQQYLDAIVLGEPKKLLYGDGRLNCMLTGCNTACMNSLVLAEGKTFCSGLEQERWKDVFFDKTYYGNKEDWMLDTTGLFGTELWRYTKDDPRVPGRYRENGITKQEFERVFGLSSPKGAAHQDAGVWFAGAYYGEAVYGAGGWCIEKNTWGILEDWIYRGKDAKVVRKMSPDTKVRVFGGLRKGKEQPYDYPC